MKVYLITLNEYDYDEYIGFVVVAENANKALKYLKEKFPEENGWNPTAEWSKGYKVKEIKPDKYKETEVILDSFNAG
jgi:hypothetical protein